MADNVCNDAAYQNMLIQKQRFQLLNIPPVRYDNLVNNPYLKINPITNQRFTKFDLDMRRKVEILKYSANNSSSQTNRFTKAELFAQVVNGKYQQRTYSNSFITSNTVNNQLNNCPSVKTATTSSDVPGPIIYLYEDENVPLYNYNNNNDANYGILTQGINPYNKTWDYSKAYNKTSVYTGSSESNAIITSIFILYQDIPTKTFTITTPIALQFAGIKQFGTSKIEFNIIDVKTDIIYNNNTYITKTIVDHIYPMNTITVIANSTDFSGTCYLGLLTIQNINLPIQKGFIYDIKTTVTYSNTLLNVIITRENIIFNIDLYPILIQNGCTITGYSTNSVPDISVSE